MEDLGGSTDMPEVHYLRLTSSDVSLNLARWGARPNLGGTNLPMSMRMMSEDVYCSRATAYPLKEQRADRVSMMALYEAA